MKAIYGTLPAHPPVPPHCNPLVTQEVNCYGDSVINFPVATAAYDSIVSVELKAQHDPHAPWSFTAVTTP